MTTLSPELIFARRSMTRSFRDAETLLMAIMLPVLMLLMFVFVFGGALEPGGEYVNYVVPGVILTCAGFGAASTALYVATDRQTGFLDRIRTLPIRSGSLLTGHVLASLARNLLATTIVIAIALLVGFRPTASLGGWVLAVALISVYILAITTLFAAIGLAAGSAEAANGYGFILLFLPYLSSAFVPTATMPGWLAPIAERLPITPIIETIRDALLGTPSLATTLIAFAWCAAISAVSVAWGAWLFARIRS